MKSKEYWKRWLAAAGIRAAKTGAQGILAMVTVGQAFCVRPGELVDVNRSGLDWNGRYRAAVVSVGMDGGGCWSRVELAPPDFVL